MQFKNKSDDAREISLDGVRLLTVEQGEAVDVSPALAAGLVLQCGPDGAWEPADDEATAAVEKATAALEDEAPADEAANETETTEPSKPKARTAKPRRSAE